MPELARRLQALAVLRAMPACVSVVAAALRMLSPAVGPMSAGGWGAKGYCGRASGPGAKHHTNNVANKARPPCRNTGTLLLLERVELEFESVFIMVSPYRVSQASRAVRFQPDRGLLRPTPTFAARAARWRPGHRAGFGRLSW